VSESSDTEQASIVFMGRESFRMQVVDTPAPIATDVGAIPTAIWQGPTARIIERRNHDRRQAAHMERALETPAPAPARNTIIGVSLLTFACGVAFATAVNRLPRSESARLERIEHQQPIAPPAAPPERLPTPTTAPTVIVEPIAKAIEPAPAPESAPAVVPPVEEPLPAKSAVLVAKGSTPPRTVQARTPRPRRPGPASTRAGDADLFADPTPPTSPAPRKWVDPFAE
jgi:hypothetical protein